jgi:Uma2 family endonuclease
MLPAILPPTAVPMTFEEFLSWDDDSDRNFELVDGIPMPLVEPTADHEDVSDFLCDFLKDHCAQNQLPYVPKRLKQVRLRTEPGEKEKSRKPDIVVFDQAEWQRMKGKTSPAAAYTCPPLVIEIVSTNWQDDYLTKQAEYEMLGILEFWIVDYAALGGRRFIGNPKQPTISIYTLVDGEYQVSLFRSGDRLISRLFPSVDLTADQLFQSVESQT